MKNLFRSSRQSLAVLVCSRRAAPQVVPPKISRSFVRLQSKVQSKRLDQGWFVQGWSKAQAQAQDDVHDDRCAFRDQQVRDIDLVVPIRLTRNQRLVFRRPM